MQGQSQFPMSFLRYSQEHLQRSTYCSWRDGIVDSRSRQLYAVLTMATDGTSQTLHPFWDRAIRFLLGRPAHLAAIIRLARPELADRLDFEHLERLDRSFVLEDYRQREADLLARLPYRSQEQERDVLIYLLVEHQSTVDAWMPLRLLLYMAQVWEDQRRRSKPEAKQAALAPIIPDVFYTGTRGWPAGRRLEDLVEGAFELLPFCPRFDILYIGLPEVSPALLESIGPLGWALRAVQRVDASRPEFAEVFEQAVQAIRPLLGAEWQELATFLYLLAANRRPRVEFGQWKDVLERSATDAGWRKELDMLGKSLVEETFEQGELKGKLEGKREGRREGRREGLRQAVLRLGRHRFGEPTPEQQSRLDAIDSLERLEMITDATMDAMDWEDLLRRA